MRALIISIALLFTITILNAGPETPVPASPPTAGPTAAQLTPQPPAPAPPPTAEGSSQLKTQKDKVSYSIGLDIGSHFKKRAMDIDPELLARGIKDSWSGNKTLLSEKEMQETLAAFQNEMMRKQEEETKLSGDKNRKEGETFLSENKKKAGVVTLPSGLQYKILKEGTGPTPKTTDTVVTNYRGTLINGAEFDSSYGRGQPATFPVTGVIPGWTEALQLMKVGSKWQLFVPAALAYGEQGAGPDIGPQSTLIFEIELLEIKNPAAK